MTCCYEDAFCSCIQCSPKIINLNATNGMTPTFYLKLNMRFREKVIGIIYICINVNSSILRWRSYGNVFKSTALNDIAYKRFKPVWINLQQVRTNFFSLVTCLFKSIVRGFKRNDFSLFLVKITFLSRILKYCRDQIFCMLNRHYTDLIMDVEFKYPYFPQGILLVYLIFLIMPQQFK